MRHLIVLDLNILNLIAIIRGEKVSQPLLMVIVSTSMVSFCLYVTLILNLVERTSLPKVYHDTHIYIYRYCKQAWSKNEQLPWICHAPLTNVAQGLAMYVQGNGRVDISLCTYRYEMDMDCLIRQYQPL